MKELLMENFTHYPNAALLLQNDYVQKMLVIDYRCNPSDEDAAYSQTFFPAAQICLDCYRWNFLTVNNKSNTNRKQRTALINRVLPLKIYVTTMRKNILIFNC